MRFSGLSSLVLKGRGTERQSDSTNKSVYSIGIVGAGEIVAKLHLPVLSNLREAKLAWITDTIEGRARALARCYRIVYSPLPKDLKDLPQADVILLGIPWGARTAYYEALRERDCSLYVEKPLSLRAEDHRRLCEWFPGPRLGCGLQRRSWGLLRMIQEVIDCELFGSLRKVRYEWGAPAAVTSARGFRNDAEMTGGVLADQAIHGIDFVLEATRAKAAMVKAACMLIERDLDVHTVASLEVRTGGGSIVPWELRASCLQQTLGGFEFEFSNAVVSLSFREDLLYVNSEKMRRPYVLQRFGDFNSYPHTEYQTAFEHWRKFIDGIRSQEINLASASSSLLTTEVLEALYHVGGNERAN